MSSTISVNVQGKTTNEVITHLEAMLKELRTQSPKLGAPENKMSKKAAKPAIDEEDEIDEDEIEAGEDDAPTVKSKKKAKAVEEDEEEEEIDDAEDEEEEDEDSEEVTMKEARDAILNLGKKKGSATAKQVLSRFNLKSVAELEKKSSAKYYAPIVDRCKALLKK